jgi:hypothetical protein
VRTAMARLAAGGGGLPSFGRLQWLVRPDKCMVYSNRGLALVIPGAPLMGQEEVPACGTLPAKQEKGAGGVSAQRGTAPRRRGPRAATAGAAPALLGAVTALQPGSSPAAGLGALPSSSGGAALGARPFGGGASPALGAGGTGGRAAVGGDAAAAAWRGVRGERGGGSGGGGAGGGPGFELAVVCGAVDSTVAARLLPAVQQAVSGGVVDLGQVLPPAAADSRLQCEALADELLAAAARVRAGAPQHVRAAVAFVPGGTRAAAIALSGFLLMRGCSDAAVLMLGGDGGSAQQAVQMFGSNGAVGQALQRAAAGLFSVVKQEPPDSGGAVHGGAVDGVAADEPIVISDSDDDDACTGEFWAALGFVGAAMWFLWVCHESVGAALRYLCAFAYVMHHAARLTVQPFCHARIQGPAAVALLRGRPGSWQPRRRRAVGWTGGVRPGCSQDAEW